MTVSLLDSNMNVGALVLNYSTQCSLWWLRIITIGQLHRTTRSELRHQAASLPDGFRLGKNRLDSIDEELIRRTGQGLGSALPELKPPPQTKLAG